MRNGYKVFDIIDVFIRTLILEVTSLAAKPNKVGIKLLLPPLGISDALMNLITPGNFYGKNTTTIFLSLLFSRVNV